MALSVSVQEHYAILYFTLSWYTGLESMFLIIFTWFLTVSHLRPENVSKALSDFDPVHLGVYNTSI